jgi:hypothetical protein
MSKKKKENEWVTYPEINPTIDELNVHFEMQENKKKVIFTPNVKEKGRIDEFPTINPEELQSPKLATLPLLPETKENLSTTISDELEVEELTMEGVEDITIDNLTITKVEEEDLNVKNYLKVSPTFYIKAVETDDEEEVVDGEEKEEIFQILNPETGLVERRELTDDEKKELFIQQLKQSRKKFNPLSHPTKVVGTTGVDHPFLKDKNGVAVQRFVKDREVQTNVTINKFDSAYRQKRQRRNKLAKASRKANR